MKIRIFEAFAGYGSQSIALQRLKEDYPGFDYEVAGFSEIDRFAVLAYYAARDARLQGHSIDRLNLEKYEPSPELLAKYPNFGDITKIEWAEVPDFDLFTYSFPCQDISTAGKQRGFDEGSGSRSSLLWECARAIEVKRPKFLLMENVKALTFKKHKDNFKRWRDTLEALGYSNYWAILNAKNFGVPQNRERVFMVSIWGGQSYEFPQPSDSLTRRLIHVLEENVADSWYLNEKQLHMIINHNERKQSEGCGFSTSFKTADGISCAVTTLCGSRPTDTYLAEPVACAYRGRNPDNPGDRRSGIPTVQRLELGGPVSSCITTVDKDSLLAEPKVLGYTRDNKGVVVARHLKDVAGTVCSSNRRYTGSTAEFIVEPTVIQLPHGFARGNVLDIAPAVTASAYTDNNLICVGYLIRKFTPRELFRLMDLPDIYIDAIQAAGLSTTQQRKLAGNSIVVELLYRIFKNLFIQ